MSKIDEALKKLEAWLVCYGIATPEDMAQSFPEMLAIVQAAISQSEEKMDVGGAGGDGLESLPFDMLMEVREVFDWNGEGWPAEDKIQEIVKRYGYRGNYRLKTRHTAAPAPEPEGERELAHKEEARIRGHFENIRGALEAFTDPSYARFQRIARQEQALKSVDQLFIDWHNGRLSPSPKEAPTNHPGHEREAQG
jgi:hypothetical protein